MSRLLTVQGGSVHVDMRFNFEKCYKLRWYAVILVQWMEGKGLNYIMLRAVEYQERHPEKFWINRYTKQHYDKNSLEHRNIVFANTLEVIENVILFSISNYFCAFPMNTSVSTAKNHLTGIIGMSTLNTELPTKSPFILKPN